MTLTILCFKWNPHRFWRGPSNNNRRHRDFSTLHQHAWKRSRANTRFLWKGINHWRTKWRIPLTSSPIERAGTRGIAVSFRTNQIYRIQLSIIMPFNLFSEPCGRLAYVRDKYWGYVHSQIRNWHISFAFVQRNHYQATIQSYSHSGDYATRFASQKVLLFDWLHGGTAIDMAPMSGHLGIADNVKNRRHNLQIHLNRWWPIAKPCLKLGFR